MLVSLRLLLCCALATLCAAEIVRYDGHKVISVQVTSKEQLEWLGKLHDTSLLDFWTHPSLIRPTDIRVSPKEFPELMGNLSKQGFNVTVVHDDVQKLIESVGQHPHSRDKRQLKFSSETVIGGFPRYGKIYEWAIQKQTENPTVMKVLTMGKTYEQRDQYVIKLGTSGVNKPAIWLDAGIHAREWIAVAAALNIIDKLLTGYRTQDSTITTLLTTFDWYIVPVANPDGYEYSHTSGNRLWRKTKTPHLYGAIGADPNRNWGYQWCITGASHVTTSNSFCGSAAWSEPCVSNMRGALESLRTRMKVFMTLHSYGQMWFVPYAWSRVAFPNDYQNLASVGQDAANAIYRANGAQYRVGRVPDLLYEASGSSMDWVKGVLGTEYAYGMELRPAGNVPNGFITTTDSIQPATQDVWEGLKVVAQRVITDMNRASVIG